MGWLTGWSYRKKVTLTEQSSGAYSDYPTIVTAAYDAHMKNDFADCRFTETDGTTLIAYGIVDKTDGVSCNFVVKRDYTSGCTLEVYLYYGNAAAADASVDHAPWASDWYLANGFGKNPAGYTDNNCASYPHSASEAIPAWADVIFGGCTANGRSRCYYGRAKINGVAQAWASTVICSGITVSYQLKWKKYYCSASMYDDAAFNAGASNTITFGHFQSGTVGLWVSYYPTDPSVSLGAEEGPIDEVELYAQFEVGQDAEDLFAEFVVLQWAEDLPAEFVVKQWQEDLLGEFIVRQETSIDLHAAFDGQTSVDLFAEFEVGQGSEDLLGEFVVRHVGTPINLLGDFIIRHETSVNLLGEFLVRHAAILDLPTEFEVGQNAEDLPAEFDVIHSVVLNLSGEFNVRHSTILNLLAKFSARHSATRGLFAEFVVLQGSEDLPAEFFVRNSGTADIRGVVFVTRPGTVNLPAEFVVGQGSQDLPAEFEVGQGRETLFGEFVIRHSGPVPWLGGWRYRKTHTITGSTAGGQTNYQVGVKVYYGAGADGTEVIGDVTFGKVYCDSKCQTDFQDIRFTNSDGTTLLDYWLQEKVDSDYAIFWVEIDIIPASPGTVDIYVYYGNVGATYTDPQQHGKDTFIIFDAFPGVALDVQWTVDANISVTVAGGILTCKATASSWNTWHGIHMAVANVQGIRLESYGVSWAHVSNDLFQFGSILGVDWTHQNLGHRLSDSHASTSECYLTYLYDNNGLAKGNIEGQQPLDLIEQRDQNGDIKFFKNGVEQQIGGETSNDSFDTLMILVNRLTTYQSPNLYLDRILARSYVDPEPAHTAWGPETEITLLAKFSIRHATTRDLPAEFVVGQGAVDLFAEFVVGQLTEDLLGEFIVRQETSVDLLGEFSVRHEASTDLFGEFYVGQSASIDLAAEFVVRNADIGDLFGEFEVRRKTSLDLPSEFIVRQETSIDLHAAFDGQTSIDLFGRFIVRQETSVDLPGEFSVRHPASEDLLCEFYVSGIIDDSENLLAEFRVRHEAAVDLLGEFTVRHEASIDLLGEFDIRQPGSVELLAEFIVRYSAILDLSAEYIVRHEAKRDLLSGFTVRHTAIVGLPAEFIVRHSASIDLVARFDGQTTVSLHAEFDIRHPYPFWTDRELLNGVVRLNEADISDAALEEVIGGVMNDVRSWLLANEVATTQWTDIVKVPLAIRRATTYGTVASMYARRIFSPQSMAVRVAPMDLKVITTHESAMEYWEGKMEEALENYLVSVGKVRIVVSTEDEDPEFTMDDVEKFSMDVPG